MQSVKFLTLGCKVNQYDTQLIREQCLSAGFKEVDRKSKTDICIVNTCTVTHKADADSLSIIRRAKRDNPRGKVVVTGCLSELDADKIRKTSSVDLLIKNRDKHRLVGILLNKFGLHEKTKSNYTFRAGINFFEGHARAFLKVQDGCDNFCSYCKVPLVRGRSKSRKKQEIILEAGRLAQNGFREIVLTGICLGAYGKDLNPRIDLAGLIAEMEKIDGLSRIRLSSIEANDLTSSLIKRISASEKVCKHLHIPLQSGDDKILKKMNRHYKAASFLKLIKAIKKAVPGIAITTDVLVGFPGESETNFSNTAKLFKKILPLKAHIFPYSARPGTQAAGFSAMISAAKISQRVNYLNKIAQACRDKYMRGFLGRKMPVLVEGKVATCPGYWQGHTDNYLHVIIRSNEDLKNRIVIVKLDKLSGGNFKVNFR
jgi:threonylcarbamoyladenosine tRNA methylthiotransferase MtaB